MTGTSGGKTADSDNVMWKNKIRKLYITLLKKNRCAKLVSDSLITPAE